MDSQHLFGAKGDTDSCLLLWAVHVTGVRICKEGGLVAAVKSKTFWRKYTVSIPCRTVNLWQCSVWVRCCITLYIPNRCRPTSHPGGGACFFGKSQVCGGWDWERDARRKAKSLIHQVIMRYHAEEDIYCIIAINTALCARLIWSFWFMSCMQDFQESLSLCVHKFPCVCVWIFLVSSRAAEAEGQRHIHKYRWREWNSQAAEVRQSAADSEGDCVSVCAV